MAAVSARYTSGPSPTTGRPHPRSSSVQPPSGPTRTAGRGSERPGPQPEHPLEMGEIARRQLGRVEVGHEHMGPPRQSRVHSDRNPIAMYSRVAFHLLEGAADLGEQPRVRGPDLFAA